MVICLLLNSWILCFALQYSGLPVHVNPWIMLFAYSGNLAVCWIKPFIAELTEMKGLPALFLVVLRALFSAADCHQGPKG